MIGKALMFFRKDTVVRSFARETGGIIYGARAMNRQLAPPYQRPTEDYDILMNSPGKNARKLERRLDRAAQGDYYYSKAALHEGTYKVMDKGHDGRKGTRDDFGIADITKPTRKVRTVLIGGINYAALSERRKDIKSSLKNPEFKYRHEKDRNDLMRIKQSNKLRRGLRW